MKEVKNLRFTFVQLLFSLAIGQVAIKVSDLIVENKSFYEAYYAYSHLILCIVVLSTSWVGFQISQSKEKLLTTIFSRQFAILIIDVGLVITYFIIVRGAEISNYPIGGHTILLAANTSNETFWCMAIFGIYLLWDVITKLITAKFVPTGEVHIKKYSLGDSKTLLRLTYTMICLIIAIFIYRIQLIIPTTKDNAFLIDLILIVLFVFFRALKQEIKPTYHLTRNEMSLPYKKEDKLIKVDIVDKYYALKFFLVKILPFPVLFCLVWILIGRNICNFAF